MPLPADPVGRQLALLLARDRYERWLERSVRDLLLRGFKEVAALVLQANLSPGARRLKQELLVQIRTALGDAYAQVDAFSKRALTGYAGAVNRATRDGVLQLAPIGSRATPGASFALLPTAKLMSIVELPVSGLSIGDWWQHQVDTMTTRVRQQIQLGLMQGEDPLRIVRRLVPTTGPDYVPVLYKQGARNAGYLVRTAVTAVENNASVKTFEAMGKQVTKKYRYVAVRDARTSAICRALDGNVYAYDDPQRKVPPQHINCRSTIVPIVDFASLGIDPKYDPTRKYSFGSYGAWLSQQSAGVQNDILGPSRADMYRAGKISLADLVNTDNRVLTLRDLRDLVGKG